MIKEYSQNRSNVILNFSLKYCETQEQLLSSYGFHQVLSKFVESLSKKDTVLYQAMNYICNSKSIVNEMIDLFKLLIVLDKDNVSKLNQSYKTMLNEVDTLIEFIEGLYTYWRKLERYALIQSSESTSGIQNINFIEASNNFSNLILTTYRRIEENILGYEHSVYRQLSAGINAGIVLNGLSSQFSGDYEVLNGVSFIKKIVLRPPFVIYPKKNTRSGLFTEVFINPLLGLSLNKSHYFCYPAKVGSSLAFIYFHRNYVNHGLSLCNLFELAKPEDYTDKKPDLIYVFGENINSKDKKTVFYQDKHQDLYVGFTAMHREIDYFGYMKKMILTLHNVRMMDQDILPIHGAMVHVTMNNGKEANIAIMGDSGAGKSESLEAFRTLSDKYLKDIKIIFDDMGAFVVDQEEIIAYGTEIGAFVRLDDLEPGYAFKEMDRAIFMNPNKSNARLVLPVSTYNEIMKGYKVDIFLYANNYENEDDVLRLLNDKETAKQIFIEGSRKAKGTTSEQGIVQSFFANPFGPVQRREKAEELIDRVFDTLYCSKAEVGVIYTKLAIEGYEQKGPEQAAKRLFEWIMNK